MSHQTKIEVIRRLLTKGFVFEAEVFCLENNVGEKTLDKLKRGVLKK